MWFQRRLPKLAYLHNHYHRGFAADDVALSSRCRTMTELSQPRRGQSDLVNKGAESDFLAAATPPTDLAG